MLRVQYGSCWLAVPSTWTNSLPYVHKQLTEWQAGYVDTGCKSTDMWSGVEDTFSCMSKPRANDYFQQLLNKYY